MFQLSAYGALAHSRRGCSGVVVGWEASSSAGRCHCATRAGRTAPARGTCPSDVDLKPSDSAFQGERPRRAEAAPARLRGHVHARHSRTALSVTVSSLSSGAYGAASVLVPRANAHQSVVRTDLCSSPATPRSVLPLPSASAQPSARPSSPAGWHRVRRRASGGCAGIWTPGGSGRASSSSSVFMTAPMHIHTPQRPPRSRVPGRHARPRAQAQQPRLRPRQTCGSGSSTITTR